LTPFYKSFLIRITDFGGLCVENTVFSLPLHEEAIVFIYVSSNYFVFSELTFHTKIDFSLSLSLYKENRSSESLETPGIADWRCLKSTNIQTQLMIA